MFIKWLTWMIPLQYVILEYIVPPSDRFISNTKVARIWHTTGTHLAQTGTHLAHKWHTTSTPYDARHRSRFGRRRCPGRKSYELATPSDLIVWVSNPYPLQYLAFQNFWVTFARLWKIDLKIEPEGYLDMSDTQNFFMGGSENVRYIRLPIFTSIG